MSWERRGNNRYYYHKRREGDRVVSQYVGAGELGQLAADMDALGQELRRARRRQVQAHRALNAQVDQVCDLIRALTYALLLVAGYHTHKGQWRKRSTSPPTAANNSTSSATSQPTIDEDPG